MTAVRGAPRDALVVAVWSVLTLGLYAAWYFFAAFREVDHQAGRRHSALWFLGFVPLAGFVFALLYVRTELRGLHADLRALGLPPTTSFRAVALWSTLGAFLLVGPLVALVKVVREVNRYWTVVYARHGVALPRRGRDAVDAA